MGRKSDLGVQLDDAFLIQAVGLSGLYVLYLGCTSRHPVLFVRPSKTRQLNMLESKCIISHSQFTRISVSEVKLETTGNNYLTPPGNRMLIYLTLVYQLSIPSFNVLCLSSIDSKVSMATFTLPPESEYDL